MEGTGTTGEPGVRERGPDSGWEEGASANRQHLLSCPQCKHWLLFALGEATRVLGAKCTPRVMQQRQMTYHRLKTCFFRIKPMTILNGERAPPKDAASLCV